mmetsp:Transcript_4042/g.6312  ORF Transcript_4042/g.6312 Transcript_4042/m.6312 type:complete len:666 (+) Transcript_4042:42-2039(+)
MSRQLGGKSPGETSEASPLSLLVHAADSQRSSSKGGRKTSENGGPKREEMNLRVPDGAPSAAIEEQLAQRQTSSRLDALNHQGLLSQLRGGALGDGDLFNQNAAIVAAQQQQQAAALALASDIRTAVAAAQLRQAAQLQNQDILFARTAALQQLGALGGSGNVDQFQQELELQRLEELERRQLLAAASSGAPVGALAARQQFELQEHQIRQEQLDRQLSGQNGESLLDRAGLRATADSGGTRSTSEETSNKDSFQKTPGSVVVPCRARGMPMDHNFKTAYFVIPENVEHGEELICSYFACRNAGIKFRYCTHCKVPVAKRNFRKRHKHGKTTSVDADEDASIEDEEENVPKPKKDIHVSVEETSKAKEIVKTYQKAPTKVEVERKIPDKIEPKVDGNASSASSQSNENSENNESVTNESNVKASKIEESRPRSEDTVAQSLFSISQQARPKISAEREHLWGQLLAKRPPTKDGEAVSAWLMEVLSVSDLDTPLKENGQVSHSARAVVSLPFKTGPVQDKTAQPPKKDLGKDNDKDKDDDKVKDKVKDEDDGTKKNKDKGKDMEIEKEKNEDDEGGDEDKDGDKDKAKVGEGEGDDSRSKKISEMTKKRPLAALADADEVASSSVVRKESSPPAKPPKKDVGSFAEWKDRKKHKGLPKKGFSMQPE